MMYLRDYGLLYWNLENWFEDLSAYEMLIGTRIHGVVSAVKAGIPAVLLAHDERTLELANVMSLPYRDIREFDHIDHDTIKEISKKGIFEPDYDRLIKNEMTVNLFLY